MFGARVAGPIRLPSGFVQWNEIKIRARPSGPPAAVAATRKKNVPTIGFIAPVDTSPELSGAGVTPILHTDYRGQDLVLPGKVQQVVDDYLAASGFADDHQQAIP